MRAIVFVLMALLVGILMAWLMDPVLCAQTCPVKHPALTALDHESMLAAYTASFRGIYGRNPTMVAGSGVDDGNYWISVSDHYGEFGDNICRAGWNAYWETKLATGKDAADPALGDQPAHFRPIAIAPAPLVLPPATDLTAVLAAIADLKTTMQAEHAEQSNILKQLGHFIADNWATIAAGFGAYVAGHQTAK